MRRHWCLAVLAGLLLLVGCTATTSWPSYARTAEPSLPAYPTAGATTAQVEVAFAGWHRKRLRFITADAPAQVIAWYQTQLDVPAWKLSVPAEDDGMLIENQDGCPVYNLRITATAIAAHQTEVDLRLSPAVCSDR